jgi:uncharacterized DUF497 family protein
MRIMAWSLTWDEPKRQAALRDRGIDFADANIVFAGSVFEFEDVREDHLERRMICFGSSPLAWLSWGMCNVAGSATFFR